MAETDEEKVEDVTHDNESKLTSLKMKKSRKKAAFTRSKNKLLEELNDETHEKELLRELIDKLEVNMDEAITSIEELTIEYKTQGKTKEMKSTVNEIDLLSKEYDKVLDEYHYLMSETSSKKSTKIEPSISKQKQVDKDLRCQLKRVSIPMFSGNKKDFPFWKAAFEACIDKTDASAEYKFLQMRQYLTGEALKTVEGLGHSAVAYDKAKERIERKYGGERRLMTKFMDDIATFPQIKRENAKSTEKFVDLLDITLVNMLENKIEDLHSGILYQQLLKKLPESMISRYERWVYENEKQESVETLSEWTVKEAEFQNIAMETKYGLDGKCESENREHKSFFTSPTKALRSCSMCHQDHNIWDCSQYKKLSIEERWEKAKCFRLCFRCLGNYHSGRQCKRTRQCGVGGCNRLHHRLLHNLNPDARAFCPKRDEIRHEPNEVRDTSGETFTSSQNNSISLRTVPVLVCANGKEIKINALLDDGSTKTYVNSDVAAKLGLTGDKTVLQVNVLNGRCEELDTMNVTFNLNNVDRDLELDITAVTTIEVTGKLKPTDWSQNVHRWAHLKGIKFPKLGKKPKIDLLIGLDHAKLHRSLEEIVGEPNSPIARLTPLGWTCIGPVKNQNYKDTCLYTFNTVQCTSELHQIDETLKRFWETEAIENRPKMNSEEVKSLKIVEDTLEYNEENKRYTVSIPWKDNKKDLVINYEHAMKRFEHTERKLNKDINLKKAYAETIESYKEKGYISEVSSTNDQEWYMPHFPVIKSDRETTKMRIVFDASAKYKDLSLNNVICQCPKQQNELFDILLRFRMKAVAIMCDIQEMYLQVGLANPDRAMHRFLWRTECSKPIETYEFNRVVFGVSASPFLAQFVSQENARRFMEQYPNAAECVLRSTYMDDTMDSVEDEIAAIGLYHELSSLWRLAGMKPRKWMTNSSVVLAEIPQGERAYKMEVTDTEMPSVKTLGLNWDSQEDMFFFRNTAVDIESMKLTKRIVLKKIASLFDPLGFLTPFTVRAKMIMQDIWVAGVDWDDELPEHLTAEVKMWFSELEQLSDVKINRCINITPASAIHTFVDASSQAFGAVVYAVSPADNIKDCAESSVRLIAAKSRVAPLKTLSIPRLELLAATLGLKLTQTVCAALGIELESTVFWSDSMNVLYWIRGASRQYKTFVANRVGTIQDATTPKQWRHVSSVNNPADIASRGSQLHTLSESELWWHGPNFLKCCEESWPENKIDMTDGVKVEMKRKSAPDRGNTFIATNKIEDNRLDPNRYSNWNRLVRIHAWVARFIDNCQKKETERKLSKELSLSEIQDAEGIIIQQAQIEAFENDYSLLSKGKSVSTNSKLAPLNPKLDIEGIMRSDNEELVTAVVGAEGMINSRPLTYQSANPEDSTVLTPNHFLHGQCGGTFAPNVDKASANNLKKRWRYIQELLRHFWKRWFQEYLPTLVSRNKWYHGSRDFQPGDVVMVIDPDIHRGQWQLGRVVDVHPGRDQRVRVVDVRVGKTVVRRPITRVSILEKWLKAK
ncbi:uncharacterized protein LOC128235822 [Mya arenaria]|uniref:uncharacterized protein LOC128235822 n=1 Tax=Mya arenaria TaxID=6604 RepID=UPI0022E5B030|nr:uncharacterized protein LOC128235822 [Mya arenaria]